MLPHVPCLALATALATVFAPGSARAAALQSGPRAVLGVQATTTLSTRPSGGYLLSTMPARRAHDSVGINLDAWSKTGAYTPERWPGLVAAVKASGISRARVDVHIVGYDLGTEREVQLGQAGIKLDVILGDAFERYSATPFSSVYDIFRTRLMPYAESVEGTNEPDLAGVPDWAAVSRAHQRQIVDAVAATPGGERLAVYAPSTGRPNNQGALGSLLGLADYANAHAYSGGRHGALGFDAFVPPAAALLPGGPTVVTETGVHTGPPGATYNQPGVPEDVQARYTPKEILEALRRGIPRTFLFDLVDRYEDAGTQAAAHFGLLHVDGTPKPAFGAVARLMAELRDPRGNADAPSGPVVIRPSGTVSPDTRILGMRQSDGSLVLALWRERSLSDPVTQTPIPAPPAHVRLGLGERYLVARVKTIAGGEKSWQFPFLQSGRVDLSLGDDVTVVRFGGRLR